MIGAGVTATTGHYKKQGLLSEAEAMDDAVSGQNLFNALYPFKSGNLPRTPLGAAFTRSVFFMESCRDEMRLNCQCRGPHSTHQQWLKTFNDWRRQAIRAVETMETKFDKPHRRAKRFICRRSEPTGDPSAELMNLELLQQQRQ